MAADSANARSDDDRLFLAGDLDGAIAAANDSVRAVPSDIKARSRLIELLCFAGQWDRADKQLDTASSLQPASQASVSLLRQLVRADQARGHFHLEGRMPEFLSEPPPHLRLCLSASIELRDGNAERAAEMLTDAEAIRPKMSGTEGGKDFTEIRDLDDLLWGVVEVLTSTGKYYLIPFEDIESINPAPVKTRLDLLWRRSHMSVRNGGPEGVVYIPCLYSGTARETDPALRLGRATQWREHGEKTPVIRGVGLRMFQLGEREQDVVSLQVIEFHAPGHT